MRHGGSSKNKSGCFLKAHFAAAKEAHFVETRLFLRTISGRFLQLCIRRCIGSPGYRRLNRYYLLFDS